MRRPFRRKPRAHPLEREHGLRIDARRHRLVCDERTVLEPQNAARVAGDVLVVGHHHDRAAGAVERLEQGQDAQARAAVESAGRLVRKDQRRVADERAGNRDALLLAA